MSNDEAAEQCFAEVCSYTGGSIVKGGGMTEIENYLNAEFGQLDLDKQVLDALNEDADWTVIGIASSLGLQEGQVDGSVRRLLSRDLVPIPEAA